MKIELVRADIVILASAHNPSMITAKWLRDKNLITEEPTQTLFTPISSLFESETFSLIVTRDRLQITAKKDNIEALKSLVNIGEEYIRLSPYIAYKALGLNFIWLITTNKDMPLPKIGINVNSVRDFKEVLKGDKQEYGAIIYDYHESYLLKLKIEPSEENKFEYNFNFHHKIEGVELSKILDFVNNYLNLYRISNEFVKATIGEKSN
jgi:hypothetical protein